MQKKSILFIAFILEFCGITYPQQYPFVQYTPKDGLVNSRVRKIFQDSKGRMYFLTYGGLSVYDGSRFKNYTTQNGLATDMVNDIIELGEDSFLVATNTNMVNLLVNGQIKMLQTVGNLSPLVNCFLKSNDGSVYATADNGLFVFKKNRFEKLPLIMQGMDQTQLFLGSITEFHNFLVFTTNDLRYNIGLYVYDKKTGVLTDTDQNAVVNGLGKDRNNRIWVSLADRIRILDTVALRKGKLRFRPMPPPLNQVESFPTPHIVFDDRYTWLNNAGKEIIRMGEDGTLLRIPGPAFESNLGLGNFFIDREKIVWLCTEGSGVFKLANTNLQIQEKMMGDNLPGTITNIHCISDTIWYVIDHKKIVRNTPSGNKVFHINFGPVRLLAQNRQNLIAGDVKNIYVSSVPETGQNSIDFKKISALKGSDVIAGKSITDSNGNLIFSSRDYIMILQDNKVFPVYPVIVSDIVEGFQKDRNNRLWVGTRYTGLSVFDLTAGYSAHHFKPVHEFAKQMAGISIRSMVIDKNDLIWIGTRHDGIVAYEFSNETIREKFHFRTQQGLTDNFVTSLAYDSSNRIIVGTQAGIDRLVATPEGDYRIENITKSNNLFGYIQTIWVDKSGQAFALRNTGNIFSIAPAQYTSSTYEPILFVEEMKINGQLVPHPGQNLKLRYNQRNISFSVAAPSFLDEKQVQYSYRLLSGENNEWSEPSGNPGFNLLNLAPGKYSMQIKATFLSTPYPPKQITYTFTILPPWWRTWWLRTLAAIALIAAITLLIRSYFKRKLEKERIALEKQQAIEKERTRIATDMHDDLGAGLSRIKYLSETIRLKKRTDETIRDEVEKISAYSDEMVEKMGEIVWALNQKNDTLADLVAFTRSYASDYLMQHGLECYTAIRGEIPENSLNGETRRNIFLSVKESLHNIVKHANATKVELFFDVKEDICIIITDNGKGFNISELIRKGNGLDNIKKRMHEVKGDAEFLNKQGTTVVLTIPIS